MRRWGVIMALLLLAAACTDEEPESAPSASDPATTTGSASSADPACVDDSSAPPVREGFDQVVTIFVFCADEAHQGFRSFGPYVGATYVGARVEDAVAIVEFTGSLPTVNNLSTANASAYFSKQLEANVFQFPEVTGLEYVVGGERWCGFENSCSPDSPYPLFTESHASPPPVLLTADRLEGQWREVEIEGSRLPICGRELPHPDKILSRDRIQLLAEPDQRGLVTHELIEYESAVAAANAIAVFVRGSRCGEFTQPDGSDTATVTVADERVEDHPRTAAMSLAYRWADGSEQAAVKTATRHGASVSYVDIDAVQGGNPRTGFVSDVVSAVENG